MLMPRTGWSRTIVALAALLLSGEMLMAEQAPQVRMETSEGTIVLELDAVKAPGTTKNFLQYVDDGFYDGTVFHRVIPGFMIQGGGFNPGMQQKQPRDPIENEADNGLKNMRGTIAMARTGDPHSATAQFFINSVDNDFLNHSGKNANGWGYAVFGEVIDGIDVVGKISAVETGKKDSYGDVPKEDVLIIKVERAN